MGAGRGPWRRHALDDLIGAGRLMALRHAGEHVAALGGEPGAAALADALGPLHQIGGAVVVIVLGMGEAHDCYNITCMRRYPVRAKLRPSMAPVIPETEMEGKARTALHHLSVV